MAELDAVDRIILAEAAGALATVDAAEVVVVDDMTGALALAAAGAAGSAGGAVRVHCDSLTDELRVSSAAAAAEGAVQIHAEVGGPLLSGGTVVLLRLPKSLAALDEIAAAISREAPAEVRLLAGGRVKHMSHGMNAVLARHFTSVAASLGQQKSRVLIAAGPQPSGEVTYPACEHHDDLDVTVCAHGGAFAGTGIDSGTRFLLSFLPQMASAAGAAADLGCGTGLLATVLCRARPDLQVQATDDSSAACRSAVATARRNGVIDRVRVRRALLLGGVPDHSLDLVLCNPPFHRGTSRDSDVAFAMFADSGRALRAGGELWTVFNSHLPYLNALRRLVGPTRIVGQNPRYVVTRSEAVHP